MNERVDGKVASITSSEAPSIDNIEFLLFERHLKKTTKLLANSGSFAPIDGQNREYKYALKEPVFISHVTVNLSGYKEYDRFTWRVITSTGEERTFSEYPKGDKIKVNIDEFCTEIGFTPPSAWFRATKIHEVHIYGFRKSDTAQFINFAYFLDSQKEEALGEIRTAQAQAQTIINEANQKRDELEAYQVKLDEASNSYKIIQEQISDASQKLNEIIAKSGATAKQLEATEERISKIHSDIKLETQKRDALSKDISAADAKLKDLKENLSLFPSEISGFVEHAQANTRIYLHYTFGPLLILCGMFLILIMGAVDLTTVITNKPDVNLSAIIVSRFPYVAVASAIIYASYRLARLFITEVMNINRQRLSLTKVSIIAKDVSQAAESQLGFTDEQIYANRLKVKMALLGDHIKHLISTEPELLFPENLFSIPKATESQPTQRRRVGRPRTAANKSPASE